MNKILIRKAQIEDAEAIHNAHMKSIQEACKKDYNADQIKAWGHRPYREDQRHFSIKNDLIWVIDDNGNIEGYGHFKIFEKDEIKKGHILGLYLTPKVIGKKLGKSIIDLMLMEANKSGVKEITLESTLTAHDFYKKAGFKDIGPETSVQVGDQHIGCYFMKMELNS